VTVSHDSDDLSVVSENTSDVQTSIRKFFAGAGGPLIRVYQS